MMVMMTTMTSQVKASSSGSSTGVSVREPLNVRLQRLLSSDQSSAYTILDILQVCFDRSFYLYLRMLRVFPCTCSFYVLVLENVKSICLHPFLLFVLENGLFVLENVKSISLHAGSSDKSSRDHQVPPRSHGEDRGRGAKKGESSFLTIIHQSLRYLPNIFIIHQSLRYLPINLFTIHQALRYQSLHNPPSRGSRPMDVKGHRSRSGRRCQHQLDRLLHLQLGGPLVHHLLQQDHLLLQLLVEQHVQQQPDAPLNRQDVQRDQQQLARHVHHPRHLDHRLLHLEKRASRARTDLVVNLATPGQTRGQQPSLDSSTSFPTSRCS